MLVSYRKLKNTEKVEDKVTRGSNLLEINVEIMFLGIPLKFWFKAFFYTVEVLYMQYFHL